MFIPLALIFIIFVNIFLFFYCRKYYKEIKRIFLDYSIIFIVVAFVICIIAFPNESIKAANDGLNMWFTVVIPALLPFFIGSELLVGLGVVSFIGTLLEPIMRPVFNVPGEGSFAFAMSVTSGYPVGVKIATKLRTDSLISQVEAQRIVSFCSTSGPLFLVGVVSIGMFKSSEVGILMATSHYLAAILVGLVFSFYKNSKYNKSLALNNTRKQNNVFKRALLQLSISRKKNPSFGILLGNAVRESTSAMLMVGGFIIMFSVIIKILNITGFMDMLSNILYFLLKPLQVEPEIIKAFISGLFEITIGSKLAANTSNVSLISRIAVVAFIISWSGFSIHAQSISILSVTDINLNLYIFAKLLHGIFSYILVYMIYPIFTVFFEFTLPTSTYYQEASVFIKLVNNIILSMEIFIFILVLLLCTAILVTSFIFVHNKVFKKTFI